MDQHSGKVVERIRDYDVIDCAVCGFRHVMPLPTREELDASYRTQYFAEQKPAYFARAAEDREWYGVVYGDRYARFAGLLSDGARRSLLDIGCGSGTFLDVGRQLGWRTLGVEPSRQAVAVGRERGSEIIEGVFDQALADSLPKFDVVHLNNVLEHVLDPHSVLSLAVRLVAPGGLLCVGVPNDYNPLQETLRQGCGYEPWWLAPPHHLNYFDFDSLERLVAKSGATPVERMTGFPMELFLLMGERYVGNDELGRACHARRKRFDQAFEAAGRGEVRRAFYQALAQQGFGREAIVIARA